MGWFRFLLWQNPSTKYATSFFEISTNRINKWIHVNEWNGMFTILYDSIHQKYFKSYTYMYIYSIYGMKLWVHISNYSKNYLHNGNLSLQAPLDLLATFIRPCCTVLTSRTSPKRQTMGKALSQFLRQTSTLENLLLTEDHLGASAVLLG